VISDSQIRRVIIALLAAVQAGAEPGSEEYDEIFGATGTIVESALRLDLRVEVRPGMGIAEIQRNLSEQMAEQTARAKTQVCEQMATALGYMAHLFTDLADEYQADALGFLQRAALENESDEAE
jgi:hypothetical protein